MNIARGNASISGRASDTGLEIYRYDAFNRLTNYNSGNAEAIYTYNADNLRASKTVNRVKTDFVWNGQNLAMESRNNSVNTYTYDMTGIHIANNNNTVYSYLKDYHGNIVGKANKSGSMIQDAYERMDYDAFGNQLNGNVPDPFGYCGEYYDSESGLIYLRNRYYDSGDGRFITEDPAKDGANWYIYAGNNPIMFVDPNGLLKLEDIKQGIDLIKETHECDKQGLQILSWYLFGNGENHFIDNDPEWSEYMKSNSILRNNVKNILINEFNSIDNNTSKWLDITTHMEIENGDNVVGYNYLHGTNENLDHYKQLGATVDDVGFRIIGNINKNGNGAVKYSLIFEWNDIMDPNPIYITDVERSNFAKTIPRANPMDYILRIKWTSEGVYNTNIGYNIPAWPMGHF